MKLLPQRYPPAAQTRRSKSAVSKARTVPRTASAPALPETCRLLRQRIVSSGSLRPGGLHEQIFQTAGRSRDTLDLAARCANSVDDRVGFFPGSHLNHHTFGVR